ncbi:MAG: hypothetical protein IJQ32_06780 [Paludibacteraceae bacterium]|nr:hypothetical protein [Paludibacteraceae bacterium]
MKKIYTLCAALMAVCSLSAKTVYLNTASSNWADANAITFIHAWGGEVTTTNVQMQPVAEGSAVLSAQIDDNNTSIVFVRMAPDSTAINWDNNWGKTGDQEIPTDKNQFTPVGWAEGAAYGLWGTYGQLPTVALVGNYAENMWGANATNTMTPANDGLTAAVTLALAAGSYEIKVWVDGYYMSLNGEGETLYGISRDWNHADHVDLVNNGRNFQLTTDVAGDYTFTWNYASLDLVVTFPTAAGIENTNANTKAVKRIVNGQLVITRDGKNYNAIGAEMK